MQFFLLKILIHQENLGMLFFQNIEIFVQLDELDELDRFTNASQSQRYFLEYSRNCPFKYKCIGNLLSLENRVQNFFSDILIS